MKTKSSKKTAQRTTESQLPSRFTMRNLGKGSEIKLVDTESGSEVRIPASAKSAVVHTLSTFFGTQPKTGAEASVKSEPATATPAAAAPQSAAPASTAKASSTKKRGRQPKAAAAAQEAVAVEITTAEPMVAQAPAAAQAAPAEAPQAASARKGTKGTSRKASKATSARKVTSARGRAAGTGKAAKKAVGTGETAQPARAAARSARSDAVKASAPSAPKAAAPAKAASKKAAAKKAVAAEAPAAGATEWTSSLPKEEKSGNITLKRTSVAVDPAHKDRILGASKEHPKGMSTVAYDILIDNTHRGHVLAQSPTRFVIVAPELQSENTIHRGLKPAILRLEVARDYMKKQA